MKTYFFILLLNVLSLSFFQNKPLTSAIKSKIEKNILIGRIINSINKDDYYVSYGSYFLEKGSHLDLKYERLDTISFPKDSSYVFYRVINIDFNTVSKNFTSVTVRTGRRQEKEILTLNYLVAIKNDDILFIGGMFNKSYIADKFYLNKPLIYNYLIKLRLFNYSISKIKFIKKDRRYLYFTAFSVFLQKKIRIKIDRKSIDKIFVY